MSKIVSKENPKAGLPKEIDNALAVDLDAPKQVVDTSVVEVYYYVRTKADDYSTVVSYHKAKVNVKDLVNAQQLTPEDMPLMHIDTVVNGMIDSIFNWKGE